MTTANDIIVLALKDAGILGVGQTPLAEDSNDALTRLNMMIAQWSRKRWLIYHLVDVPLQSTGALSYTIGAGGNFNVTRPDRIEAAYARQTVSGSPNQVDYPLDIIFSREDYSKITLKSLSTFPNALFYDSAFPLGNIYVWPAPGIQYEIHLVLKDQLAQFPTLTTIFNLPPEYQEAIVYNLAGRLCVAYGKAVRPELQALAQAALSTIRVANTQIPTLIMPRGLVAGGNPYNIYSDNNS